MSEHVDIGPMLYPVRSTFPGADTGDEGDFRVDITNIFYELNAPDVWIAPRQAFALVGGSSVTFSVTGSNIPSGVLWSISPDIPVSGATITNTDWHYATATPGNVVTTYLVRASAVDSTNVHDQVPLTVSHVDILETNVYGMVSNLVSFHLTPDSYTNVYWVIAPQIDDGAAFQGTRYGTSVVINCRALVTNYIIRAKAVDQTNCYDEAQLSVIIVDIIQTSEWACAICSTNIPFAVTADSCTNIIWTIQPNLGTNGALFANGATSQGTTNTATGINVWIDPGNTKTNYTITAYAYQLTNYSDFAILMVKKPTTDRKYAHAGKGTNGLSGVSANIKTRYGQIYGEQKCICAAYQVAYANISDETSGMKWAQSGWGRERNPGSTNIITYRYAEMQGNDYFINYDTDNSPAEGSGHTYKCQLDPLTGKWEFFFDGTKWQQYTDNYWTNHQGNVSQYTGEIYNKEDDMPGSLEDKCRFQQCQFRTNDGSFTNAGLTAGDVTTDEASEWGAAHVDGTTFDIWDVNPGQ